MRPPCRPGLIVPLLALGFLAGCPAKPQPRNDEPATSGPQPAAPAPAGPAVVVPAAFYPALPEPTPLERYTTKLLEGLSLRSDGKQTEALAALEAARSFQDNEVIQREIEKQKALLARQAATEQTLTDIQTVLAQGKADEAGRLTSAALEQYGGTDAAERLVKLKRQADALAAVGETDRPARRGRLCQEGDAALKEQNLRAAAVAYEQALAYGDDPNVRRQLADVQASLSRYDDNRKKAAELRRDPALLENALAAYQEAAKAWDTVQIRQEIDACTLALQQRRERISVADFEVRGDVGLPAPGRTVAEELLPAFKVRFDLVERAQIGKIVQELKLEASDLSTDDNGRRELGKLAKLRYLVVGSISPLCGVTVNARLVDVRTGLVVQTAKVSATTAEALLPLLPQLAGQLMLSDAERIAYEQELNRRSAVVVQPVVVAPLPEPPPPLASNVPPPPPVIVGMPQAPEFGGLRPVELDNFPTSSAAASVQATVAIEREGSLKQRSLQVAVELGDNLFRRGRYKEAHSQFEFALSLSPGRRELQVRLDQCKPRLPPPEVVVVAPPPPRPRVAVLNFLLEGDPAVVPPGLSAWTAENLGPYLCSTYDVADRAEVFWHMGRLGLTVRDLAVDPAARQWLGRALRVRYFVLGGVRQGGGLDVSAHLIDAEYGYETGAGRILVQGPSELRLRLADLARLMLMDPAQRDRYLREAAEYQALLVQARQQCERKEFTVAFSFYEKARQLRPQSVEVAVLIERTQDDSRVLELELARRRDFERQQERLAAEARRQQELTRQAQMARAQAEQQAAVLTQIARQQQEVIRQQAYNQLVVQAQIALQQQQFQASIQMYESALALKQSDECARQLAAVRVRAAEAARVRAAQEQAQREAELRRQREAELAQARAQLEQERQRHEAEAKARLQAQAARDQEVAQAAAANARLAQARQQAEAKQREQAQQHAADLQKAQQEADQRAARVRQLVATARTAIQARQFDAADKALAEASQLAPKDPAVAQALQDLNQARATLAAADAEQKKRQADYQLAMKAGRDALAAKRYDDAVRFFTDAGRALPGDRDAAAQLTAAGKARDETRAAQDAEAHRRADFARWMNQGQAALAGKRFDEAAKAFGEALKASPNDPTATKALADAQRALDASKAPPPVPKLDPGKGPPPVPRPDPKAEYAKQMQAGSTLEKQQKLAEALQAYREALKLLPGDGPATEAVKRVEFPVHMAEGNKLLAAKKFAEAAREFDAALKLVPTSNEAKEALKRAKEGRP